MITRRTFLRRAGFALGALVVAGCSSTESAPPEPVPPTGTADTTPTGTAATTVAPPEPPEAPPEAPPVDVTGPPTGSLDPVLAAGRAFLRAHPEEAQREALAGALGIEAGARDVRAVLGRIGDAVRADFGAGRIVAVDGWRLALTEARAAALVFLVEA